MRDAEVGLADEIPVLRLDGFERRLLVRRGARLTHTRVRQDRQVVGHHRKDTEARAIPDEIWPGPAGGIPGSDEGRRLSLIERASTRRRPVSSNRAAHRISKSLHGEIAAGRKTGELVTSRAIEAHQRVEYRLRALVVGASHASEPPDPSEGCDGSLGCHRSGDDRAVGVADFGDGDDGADRGDPVADVDQQLRVRQRRLGELAKVQVDEMLSSEAIALLNIAGMLDRHDQRRDVVRDGRVGEEGAHVRLHVGAVEDECVRHCCAECLSADADAEC